MRMQPWDPVWIKHRGPLHELTGSHTAACTHDQPAAADHTSYAEQASMIRRYIALAKPKRARPASTGNRQPGKRCLMRY